MDLTDDFPRLSDLAASTDPRTITEMIEAEPYEVFTVEKAERSKDGESTTVEFDGGLGTSLKGPEVKVGDTIWLYTGGRPAFGSERHGWALNGKVIEWQTPWERFAERVRWLADNDRRKREEFEKNREQMDARYEALPVAFKKRIDRFRAERADFRIDSEAYEMAAVVDGAKIAEHLRPKVPEGESAKDTVQAFYDLPWSEQKALIPDLDDGHSGNTFGGACMLARADLDGEDL